MGYQGVKAGVFLFFYVNHISIPESRNKYTWYTTAPEGQGRLG